MTERALHWQYRTPRTLTRSLILSGPPFLHVQVVGSGAKGIMKLMISEGMLGEGAKSTRCSLKGFLFWSSLTTHYPLPILA